MRACLQKARGSCQGMYPGLRLSGAFELKDSAHPHLEPGAGHRAQRSLRERHLNHRKGLIPSQRRCRARVNLEYPP